MGYDLRKPLGLPDDGEGEAQVFEPASTKGITDDQIEMLKAILATSEDVADVLDRA